MRRRPHGCTLFPYTTLFRSLLEALGGEEGCRGLCAAFYAHAGKDPVLRPFFPGKSLKCATEEDRKSTRLNSSHTVISYAVFCLKKKISHVLEARKRIPTPHR